MATVEVDIDIEDYLDEVSDKKLIDELKRRGYKFRGFLISGFELPTFETKEEQIKHLYEVMGINKALWFDQKRLKKEINDLLDS